MWVSDSFQFFPGYEGVPDFFTHVTEVLKAIVESSPVSSSSSITTTTSSRGVGEEDSGIDTGDSSDEKRHQGNNQSVRVKRSSALFNSTNNIQI